LKRGRRRAGEEQKHLNNRARAPAGRKRKKEMGGNSHEKPRLGNRPSRSVLDSKPGGKDQTRDEKESLFTMRGEDREKRKARS